MEWALSIGVTELFSVKRMLFSVCEWFEIMPCRALMSSGGGVVGSVCG